MRLFIYQDEKSHKFWAVEQQGNELHISWGKVGTKGQSQIKSFSDAAAAAKAELKLIAEKVKKGYVEQAKVNSLQPSQTVTGSLKVADLSTIIQLRRAALMVGALAPYIPGEAFESVSFAGADSE